MTAIAELDIPREITSADLADELGISHQTLSERFRRTMKNLVMSALFVEEDGEAKKDEAGLDVTTRFHTEYEVETDVTVR